MIGNLAIIHTGFHPNHACRALAVVIAFGPQAGIELVDALTSEPSLQDDHPLPSVRGDRIVKHRGFNDARLEFERGASLTSNSRERGLLLERASSCEAGSTPPEPRARKRRDTRFPRISGNPIAIIPLRRLRLRLSGPPWFSDTRIVSDDHY